MREEVEVVFTRLVLKPVEMYTDRKTQIKKQKEDNAPIDLSIPEVQDNLLAEIKDPNADDSQNKSSKYDV